MECRDQWVRGTTLRLLTLAATATFCGARDCDPITGEGGEGEPFSIECPRSDDGITGEIKILKANFGYNCNEQCKCGSSSGCMPCCSTGGPCCPSCLEPKGNDYTALAAACDGKARCEYPGPNIGDPAGGCGKKYEYIYGCCGADESYEFGGLSWGESFLIAFLLLLAVYASLGMYLRSTGAQQGYLPNKLFWKQCVGLVRDGVEFSFGRGRPGTAATNAPSESNHTQPLLTHKECGQGGSGNTTRGRMASRGSQTQLHSAAATGNAEQLAVLLGGSPLDANRLELLNAGDQRGWTAFHCACAGGHVECVETVLSAGCDTRLFNDTGHTGWDLATELKRTQVIALRVRKPNSTVEDATMTQQQPQTRQARNHNRSRRKRPGEKKTRQRQETRKQTGVSTTDSIGSGTRTTTGANIKSHVVL